MHTVRRNRRKRSSSGDDEGEDEAAVNEDDTTSVAASTALTASDSTGTASLQAAPTAIGHDAPQPTSNGLSPGDDDTSNRPPPRGDLEYEKYIHMLSKGLPAGAVRAALQNDGHDASILGYLGPEKTNGSLTSQGLKDSKDFPALRNDPVYKIYFQMLSKGLSKSAVQSAMQRDGLDPAILNLDPDKSLASQTAGDDGSDTTGSRDHVEAFVGTQPGAVRVDGINRYASRCRTEESEEAGQSSAAMEEGDRSYLAVAVEVGSGRSDGGHGDNVHGEAMQFDPSAKVRNDTHRPFRLYVVLGLAVAAAVAVGTAVAAVFVTPAPSNEGDDRDMTPSSPFKGSQHYYYYEAIRAVVGDDVLVNDSSPYLRALEWIAYEDPMTDKDRRPNDDTTFIQRYVAAYFYFSTTANGARPWKACNPPAAEVDRGGNENDSGATRTVAAPPHRCMWPILGDEKQMLYDYFPANSWLSWGGVKCDALNQVVALDMSGSGLSGSFPEGIFYWPLLSSINFVLGNLTGPLPTQLGKKLKHLTKVYLGRNYFTGSIPDEWWQARQFRRLSLTNNLLTGFLPPEMGNLLDLTEVAFSQNHFTGTIPTEVGLLNGLFWFDLSRNDLEGTIPPTIQHWEKIKEFDLRQNRLEGTIPAAIGSLKKLESLKLSNNPLLSGSLPESMFSLSRLEVLALHACSFSGTLSPRVAGLKELQVLQVSNNKFSGEIPRELAGLENLWKLWLHGNLLTGTVPNEVCSRFENVDADSDEVLIEYKADCLSFGGASSKVECICCTGCCSAGRVGSTCVDMGL